jgi:hypothetical protein
MTHELRSRSAAPRRLTVGKLEAWLGTNGKSPREQAVKVTLRELQGRE